MVIGRLSLVYFSHVIHLPILVKKNERPHIFTVWLQRVQLEIAAYVSVEIFKGNTQGASSFLS